MGVWLYYCRVMMLFPFPTHHTNCPFVVSPLFLLVVFSDTHWQTKVWIVVSAPTHFLMDSHTTKFQSPWIAFTSQMRACVWWRIGACPPSKRHGGGTPCDDNHLQITELIKPFNIYGHKFPSSSWDLKIIVIISQVLSSFDEPLGGYLIGQYMWMVK
jgi:hypothetical protein